MRSELAASHPRCAILSSTKMTIDPVSAGGLQTVPDNVYWGCAPEAVSFTSAAPPARARTRPGPVVP